MQCSYKIYMYMHIVITIYIALINIANWTYPYAYNVELPPV